jgi:chromosome segregation ATPase
MEKSGQDQQSVDIRIQNIGGIDETSIQIHSGVTALVGENATNRTSLLQAIAAALGTDSYTLKSDAEAGEVTMTMREGTYVRRLRRENGHVESEGDSVLENPALAELFAVLVDSNDVRRAVREGRDLREVILEPVDIDEIHSQITELVDRRREIDRELDRLEILDDELTELELERTRQTEKLEEIETELAETRAKLDGLQSERGDRERSAIEAELDEKLTQLGDTRDELERVTAKKESEQKRLTSLRENRATIRHQYESQTPPDEAELARLEERLDVLRDRQRSLSSTITELQQVIRFNEDRLAESESLVHGELGDGDQSVTDRLDPASETVTCWTCGSTVEQQSIEQMVGQLKDLREEKTEEKRQTASEIADVRDGIEQMRTRRQEYEELDEQLTALEAKIEDSEATVADLETRSDALEAKREELEAAVEQLQETQQDELLELRQRASELEYEKGRIEGELDSVTTQIAETEQELTAREELLDERETIVAELRDLRTRIERIERNAVEAFNTHMAELLDILEYENIGRIWVEQTETEIADGSGDTTQRTFELHVVREGDDGAMYEDTIDHLSESEREITGLVVALAGYLVHDVHESVPFMLLDSVEMIDGERLVDLVSYLEEYVPYLVVVLLPDHARTFERRLTAERHHLVEV